MNVVLLVLMLLLKRLAISAISPLYMDRFGRYLRFCSLEFDVEAISAGFMAHQCF